MFPIRLDNVRFEPNGRTVLAGIDLTLDGEGISVVLGPNGAGKSVLMRLLAGLLRPHAGRIDWGGRTAPNERVAMVFQEPMLIRASVWANVALGLRPLRLARDEQRRRVVTVLQRVGLAHRAQDSARLLSGGEIERLALARAWAAKPRLLLLDEPTASLDPTATEAVERIVREIRTDGTKIFLSTHNLAQAMRIADDIVFIAAGRIGEHAPAARFFARPRSKEAQLFIQGELPWRISFPA
ncbi:MAG TPA: ATP-binding cassette domain-containing protein [Burkholderiaceae bacterium]|nr:ATP-binding cassette domain-containing protein [Burkholderiaceae bacterium]